MQTTQNLRIRRLVLCALLCAVSIVFSRVFTISTGFLRFNLGSLPIQLAGIAFGPLAGFAVGAVSDLVGGVAAGYAINPLITLGTALLGLAAGLAEKYLKAARPVRIAAGAFGGHILGSMLVNSLALRVFYGYAWGVLALRIPNYLVLSAAETVLLGLLLQHKGFCRALYGR